jgi:AGCS family alanine or glycine:cation symporter
MIEEYLGKAVGLIWNYPVVGLCFFAGLFCTLRLFFVQVRCFAHAMALVAGLYDHDNEPGELTHFQALSAALSGTVGLGNIAGVAIAIAMGGPGSVFWMWVIAFLGMASKFMECSLGMLYRGRDESTGEMRGGAMYYITQGLGEKWKPMAVFFSACLALGTFGGGNMFQSNQVALAVSKYANIPHWVTGALLAFFLGITIIGGIKRIGAVASKIVPLMCALYLLGAFYVCALNIDRVPSAYALIFHDAFTGWAVAGGSFGVVLITGVRRAVFSNEAGLGTAPIAHSTVKTNYPIREGIVASLGPFIDTMVVCSATALVIILSGNYGTEMPETVNTQYVSDQDVQAIDHSKSWTIGKENIPAETETLRNFQSGENVFVHSGASGGSITSPAVSVIFPEKRIVRKNQERAESQVCDGMRFSCYRGEGDLSVEVLDKKGTVLGKLKVDENGDAVMRKSQHSGEEKELLSLSPCIGNDHWHSHVINFDDAFKKQVAKAGGGLNDLSLRFTTEDKSAPWYIDRFQSVQNVEGITLTTISFDKYLKGFGSGLITLAIILFCYSTMVTWSYYGEISARYLFGSWISMPFKFVFCLATYCGAIFRLKPVLDFSDLTIGLMIIPNFIAIMMLSNVVVKNTKEYFAKLKNGDFANKT